MGFTGSIGQFQTCYVLAKADISGILPGGLEREDKILSF